LPKRTQFDPEPAAIRGGSAGQQLGVARNTVDIVDLDVQTFNPFEFK